MCYHAMRRRWILTLAAGSVGVRRQYRRLKCALSLDPGTFFEHRLHTFKSLYKVALLVAAVVEKCVKPWELTTFLKHFPGERREVDRIAAVRLPLTISKPIA